MTPLLVTLQDLQTFLETSEHCGLDQVIVGGESGPKARQCDVEWIRSMRDQCQNAGTKCYVKQMSVGGNMTTNVQSFPKDLQVRELGWR